MPEKPPEIGVLSTLALLKANFDESQDHIGMFLPFVVDAIAGLGSRSFITEDIASRLSSTFELEIPLHTVKTLLNRAVKRGYLQRSYGRYEIAEGLPESDLLARADNVRSAQMLLANAFLNFAHRQGEELTDAEAALTSIFDFLGRNHVSILLDEGVPDRLSAD
ncbi:MAG: hypothetical protein O3A53_12690 [Acidobacteria bacterium]|nr:hypothetical protein [Acidobacteriota bacterium]MDA1235650.1 hypothetical protein [Acidobacteriota bacterium]